MPAPGRTLVELIHAAEPVAMPGVVLQELLSGLKHRPQFDRLRTLLEPFPVVLAEPDDHVKAAEITNACRAAGVQAATVDSLIAATAANRRAELLTSDRDYLHMARIVDLDVRFVEPG